jgi:hypothetical protein
MEEIKSSGKVEAANENRYWRKFTQQYILPIPNGTHQLFNFYRIARDLYQHFFNESKRKYQCGTSL